MKLNDKSEVIKSLIHVANTNECPERVVYLERSRCDTCPLGRINGFKKCLPFSKARTWNVSTVVAASRLVTAMLEECMFGDEAIIVKD